MTPLQWILKEFKKEKQVTTHSLSRKFEISRQAAHRYLSQLVSTGKALRLGGQRNSYYLANKYKLIQKIAPTRRFQKCYPREGLQEDQVYLSLQNQGLLNHLSNQVKTILHYAFTEMLNNAIDHSLSLNVSVDFKTNKEITFFSITDHGLGIFNNIRQKKNLRDTLEAIQELIKGKNTTMPLAHSGEGIFFTSKVADRLELSSEGKKLLFNNELGDVFVENVRKKKGTKVLFMIKSQSHRDLHEVFKEYTNIDYGFDKTKMTIKLYEEGDQYISRSQAKRLLVHLDQFKRIILDFKGVQTIGQGFADEVFRVFKNQHPSIEITAINANENVLFMIHRTQPT